MMSSSWGGTLLTTYDGGKTVVRDSVERDLHHAQPSILYLYDSLFFFRGHVIDDNIINYAWGFRDVSGEWLNKGYLDRKAHTFA